MVFFRVSSHYNSEQEKWLNVEKFIILQVCYYLYRAIAFNNKKSLYPSRREYVSVLNCGQNVQVNWFFPSTSNSTVNQKISKTNFFCIWFIFSICLIEIRGIVCIILLLVLIKKLLGKKSFFKNPIIYVRQKPLMLGYVNMLIFFSMKKKTIRILIKIAWSLKSSNHYHRHWPWFRKVFKYMLVYIFLSQGLS